MDDLDRHVRVGHEGGVQVIHPERLHGDGAERDRLVDRDHQPVLPRAIEDREDALGVVHRVLADSPKGATSDS